jgi:hypothetical protein
MRERTGASKGEKDKRKEKQMNKELKCIELQSKKKEKETARKVKIESKLL